MSFAPGETAKTISVTIIGDTVQEPTEDFFVNLSNPANATISDGQGKGTINDNDPTPTLAIDTVTANGGNSGTTAFNFTVTKTGNTSSSVTVDYATVDGTATIADTDYAAQNGTLTFLPAETTKAITISVKGDAKFEPTEAFTVHLSNASGAIISAADGTGTITNDDSAPTFSIDDVAHNEGNDGLTTYTFTITRTGATAMSATVSFATVDGSATVAGNDYQSNSGTITFPPNFDTAQFNVLVNGYTTVEPDEAFTVHLSNPDNATILDADGTGTITNDDNSGTFQFSAANYTVNESRPTATITVTRTGSTSGAATIHYATSDGTATAGADYDSTSGDLNFANGDASKTFTVGIINDTATEPNETVTLTLSTTSTGAVLGTPNPATLTIVDNDGAASSNIVVVTPTNLQGWAAFNEQTASAAFVNGPATPPYGSGSYQELTGAGTGPNAGGKSYFKTDNYNGTRLDAISSLSYRTYVDPSSQATDNLAPVIEIMVDVDNNGSRDTTFIFEPVYSAAEQGAVQKGVWQTWNARAGTWRVSRTVGPIAAGTYFSYDTFVAAFPDAKIVQWFPRADGFGLGTVVGQSSGDIWANFVGNVDGFEIGVNNASTINNYELALPTISIDDASFTEGDSVLPPHFNVMLSGVSSQTVTVAYATADGTATAGSDYTATSGTLTFAPGETTMPVIVNIIGDTTFEPDETFFVNLSAPTNATIADAQGVGTITNDDVAPTLSINDVFVAEPTAGTSNATFTVTLSQAASNDVTVTYATADDTATAPADYTATSGTLTFTPGQTSKTVNVAINADALTEGSETFTVLLSNPSSNATIADGTGQGTNTDPVAAGQLLISELRFRGPTFSAGQNIDGARDEYVELYNNTNQPITVATTDGSQGWTLAASDANGTTTVVLVTIPNGTVIPARGHFLAVNSDEDTTTRPHAGIVPEGGYSLNGYAVGDAFYLPDVSDDAGVAVFNTTNTANFTAATRLDAAGFAGPANVNAALYREGAGMVSPGANDGQYAFVRRLETGLPQDTDNNAADFVFVSTDGGIYGGVQSILGAPGPENCGCYPTNVFANRSPVQHNADIKASLIDPQVVSTAPPNRIRDNAATGPNATLGTLEIRRRFRNQTGQIVSRLRFRVVDVTTLNSPNPGGQQADLRWLSSADTMVTTSQGVVTVRGTVIEAPPTQPNGGGLNTSGIINLPGGTLAPNSTVDVRFVLGIQTGGRFRFLINVEALP